MILIDEKDFFRRYFRVVWTLKTPTFISGSVDKISRLLDSGRQQCVKASASVWFQAQFSGSEIPLSLAISGPEVLHANLINSTDEEVHNLGAQVVSHFRWAVASAPSPGWLHMAMWTEADLLTAVFFVLLWIQKAVSASIVGNKASPVSLGGDGSEELS